MPSGSPKYTDPDELQKKIDEYFDFHVKGREATGGNGDPIKITITGLCLYLGFCSRQSFYHYGEDEVFCYTIKKAHMRIEQHYENHLIGQNVAGPIFALKNLQWKDKTEQDINLQVEKQILKDLT